MKISIFGGSELERVAEAARAIARRLAELGHQVVTGGTPGGVPEAASQGAVEGGLPSIGVTFGKVPANEFCRPEPEQTFGQRLERLVIGSESWIFVSAEGSCGAGIELLTALQFKAKKKLPGKLVIYDLSPEYLQAIKVMAGEKVSSSIVAVATVEEVVREVLS